MTEQEIIFKSFKLINENGLENFSMRKLANELGCQPASIYHYYKNKNEILNSLYVTLYENYFLELFDLNDLREVLMMACKKVQVDRDVFLFLKKHRFATFLTDESRAKVSHCHIKYRSGFNSTLSKDKNSRIDYLIAMGPISEIATLNLELSQDEMELLVDKILCGLKGGK